MVTVEGFSRLVSGIYAAAVTPQHWGPALREVVWTLDGAGGGVVSAHGSSRWQLEPAIAPEAAKSYARALVLVSNESERRFLERRLREL